MRGGGRSVQALAHVLSCHYGVGGERLQDPERHRVAAGDRILLDLFEAAVLGILPRRRASSECAPEPVGELSRTSSKLDAPFSTLLAIEVEAEGVRRQPRETHQSGFSTRSASIWPPRGHRYEQVSADNAHYVSLESTYTLLSRMGKRFGRSPSLKGVFGVNLAV